MKLLKTVLAFIVVFGLGYFALKEMNSRPASPAQPLPNAPSDQQPQEPVMTGWEVAENGAIKLAYPPEFKPYQAMEPYYFLAQDLISLYTDSATYKAANYTQDGRLIVSKAEIDEKTCYTAPEQAGKQTFSSDILLNSTAWKSLTFKDAAAGNRYETTLYRTFKGTTCYEIAASLHYASDFTNVDEKAMVASQETTRSLLTAIVATTRVK